MTEPSELLTTAEAARRLRISERTLRRWSQDGTGPPSFKVGRAVRYPRAELEQWLQDQRRQKRSP